MTPARLALIAALSIASAGNAAAQGYPFSQRGSVSQDIALTTISITYGRPVARGRALFGALVPWDSVWHPGADSATRVVISHDITVNGSALKAGEYSLWLVPREHLPWTVIFHRAAHTFHKPYPGASGEVLRIEVPPESLSNVESLAIYFPRVIRDEGDLRIHWGTTGVTMRIKAPYKPDGP